MRVRNILADYVVPTNFSKVATADGLILEVDTTEEAVTVTLPPIGVYSKIIVVDKGGNAATNNITIQAQEEEWIEGASSSTINKDGGSTQFEATSATTWDELGVAKPVDPTGPLVVMGTVSQAGTDAPVVTVTHNTTGIDPVAAFVGTGQYTITFADAPGAIIPLIGNSLAGGTVDARDGGDGIVSFRTYDATDELANSVLLNTPFVFYFMPLVILE